MPSTTSTTDAAAAPLSPRLTPDLRALTARWVPLRARTRAVAYFLYYLAIIVALVLIYSRGNFTTPPFIYQGF